MAKKTLNIGLVGYGFMGRTHAHAYHNAAQFFDLPLTPVLKAVCGRDGAKAKAFADNWGATIVETDWKKLIANKDIDAIDIVTPNDSHAEIAMAAAKAGKMVLCEKPLALDGKQGAEMVKVIEKSKVPNTVWYNYRRVPAVTLAKQIIDSGKLGKIFHYRANFLQDWTISAELSKGGAGLRRLDASAAGGGVTGDLLAHCIDTALWLNGPLADVTAMTETFIKERKHTLSGKVEKVKIDDACTFMGQFASTRYARGHKALYTLEINGADASIRWDLHDLHRLQYFDSSEQRIVHGSRRMCPDSSRQRGKDSRSRLPDLSVVGDKDAQLPEPRTMPSKEIGRVVRVFASYAREDAPKMLRMRKIVEIAKHELLAKGISIEIRFWADDELCVGEEWQPSIHDELMHADIIVELLSFEFLCSPFIREVEHPLALKRACAGDASLFAVILENCPWRSAGLEPWQVALNGRPLTHYPRVADAWYDVYTMFIKVVSKWATGGGPSPESKAA